MSILLNGSLDLTLILEKAKAKHSAFSKSAKNGHIYFNITQWVNDGVKLSRDPQAVLRGVSVDLKDMSDLVPTVAAVALFAQGASSISGVGFIRNKESDRLGDLAFELRKCDADVEVLEDGLRILPRLLCGADLGTHHDHRLAMAFGLVALKVSGVTVEDPEVVSKSWPMYWEMREQMLRSSDGR